MGGLYYLECVWISVVLVKVFFFVGCSIVCLCDVVVDYE